ncbi:hypothetical protein [Rubellicoccus peritrichatus]|uniref:Uncharacterized protein n=1 Tax=Rubellicoccus peritrichatus TaxID=3080537 RepID=A0AAQ3QUI5_9BACT|nr:hypothetical protein [Puniceicoccus sp. CR14]WOO40375.1 hypothetical protein RZN69_17285 [Puniceicoccus sp. CR14]WOO40424.1 hypothetical protein RZN69_17530 [Puniceicoccus sp. CR14]WOO40473.1 hypothetical protein RZN69_17775 [Puniceicoccus sp. CR14]WOO40522.1 hypothetical protein RZN69_18020 [Puniceicoccus sp. CR14]
MADVKVKVGTDNSLLDTGLAKAQNKVQAFATTAARQFAKAFAFASVLLGLKRMYSDLDRIDKLSKQLGDGTSDFIQDLSIQADLTGANLEYATRGLKRFIGEVNRAGGPTQSIADEMKALGLTVEDFKDKSPEEVFMLLANTVGGLTTESDRLAAITGLLGNRYTEILPLLQDVAANGLARASKASEGAVKSTADFNDQLALLANTVKGFLFPVLDVFNRIIGVLRRSVEALGRQIGNVISLVMENVASVGQAIDGILSLDVDKIKDSFARVSDNFRITLSSMKAEAKNALEDIGSIITTGTQSASDEAQDILSRDPILQNNKRRTRRKPGPSRSDETAKKALERLLDKDAKGRSKLDEIRSRAGLGEVASITAIGGGGGFASADPRTLERLAKQQLDKLEGIKNEIRKLKDGGASFA